MVDFNCHLDTIYNHLGMRLSKELSRLSRPMSMLFFCKITEEGGSISNMAAPLHELTLDWVRRENVSCILACIHTFSLCSRLWV